MRFQFISFLLISIQRRLGSKLRNIKSISVRREEKQQNIEIFESDPIIHKQGFDEINCHDDIERLYREYIADNVLNVDSWLFLKFGICLYPQRFIEKYSAQSYFHASIYLQMFLEYQEQRKSELLVERKLGIPSCSDLMFNLENSKSIPKLSSGQSWIFKLSLLGPKFIIKFFHHEIEAEREQNIISRLSTPNISLPVCFGKRIIAFPYMKLGDLFNILVVRNRRHPPDQTFLSPFFKKIAKTLRSIHQQGIIHLDIKPENIVVDGPDMHFIDLKKDDEDLDDYNPIIIDFGSAIALDEHDLSERETIGGTFDYRAPEQFWTRRDHVASDWWQLGVTLWTCAILHEPTLNDRQKNEILDKENNVGDTTMGPIIIQIPEQFGDSLNDVLEMLLEPNPDNRNFDDEENFQRLINMPFFN